MWLRRSSRDLPDQRSYSKIRLYPPDCQLAPPVFHLCLLLWFQLEFWTVYTGENLHSLTHLHSILGNYAYFRWEPVSGQHVCEWNLRGSVPILRLPL